MQCREQPLTAKSETAMKKFVVSSRDKTKVLVDLDFPRVNPLCGKKVNLIPSSVRLPGPARRQAPVGEEGLRGKAVRAQGRFAALSNCDNCLTLSGPPAQSNVRITLNDHREGLRPLDFRAIVSLIASRSKMETADPQFNLRAEVLNAEPDTFSCSCAATTAQATGSNTRPSPRHWSLYLCETPIITFIKFPKKVCKL